MTQKQRAVIYIVIATVVVAIAWFGMPNHTFTPRGVFLPTGVKYHATSPHDVFVSTNEQKIIGTPIGTINIEAYVPTKHSKRIILAAKHYAIILAAQHGADRLLITMAGIDTNSNTLILRANALRSNSV